MQCFRNEQATNAASMDMNFRLNEEGMRALQSFVDEDCSRSLQELQLLMMDNFGIHLSTPTIHRYIAGFRYSLKRLTIRAAAAVTPQTNEVRREYSLWLLAAVNSNRTLIFLDEVGFSLSMRVGYGRSLVGNRATMVAPAIRSKNITVMAAMTSSGLLHYQVLEGPGNIERFCRFIEDLAAKCEAASLPADSILIMDNVAFHRGGQSIEKIRTLGLNYKFLPPYSPFFNPIEFMFAQWKNLVKRAQPSTEVQLLAAINGFDAIVTPHECFNYCQHATNNCVAFLMGEEVPR
jgi:hypothetical protein